MATTAVTHATSIKSDKGRVVVGPDLEGVSERIRENLATLIRGRKRPSGQCGLGADCA
jgi:hypothetical protein